MRLLPGIVAHGPAMFRRSRHHAAARSRLRAEALVRHGGEIAAPSYWRRLLVWGVIEREVRSELGRIYPPDALSISGGRR
jgi:hypothetical protein